MAFAAESDGAMRFVLTLDGPSSRPVHVDYTAADGTATGVADYVATAGSVTFRPGQTLATVVVPLRGDASAEQVETLELRLSNPDGGVLGTDRVAGIIVDDDHPSGAPTIQARGAVVDERDGLAVVSLSLDRPASGVVTLAVATVDGTATAGQDYVNQGVQTVVFGPGEVSRTVAVPLPDGAVAERPEFFDIVLSAPVGGTLQDERVHVVVGASDAAKVAAPVAHVGDAVAHEGDGFAEFVVSLDAPSDRVSSVMWATRAGSAGAGSDFVSASGLLTFAPGETLKALQVALRDDTLAETSETFFLDLTPVAGIAIGRATAVGTILDDDSPAAARAGAEANGGDGPDVLAGGRADDLLRAGGGADVISGGPGDDWLFGDAGDDLLLGDDGDDSLIGGAGADVLVGGPGDDTMEGGAGNDVYRVDSPRDRTVEADGEGIDSVRSPISWTLGAQIENLTLVGRADRAGTGNALDNSITGNDGDNLLRGKQGADTLSGESGADTLDGGPGADTLTGGPDADVFRFASELLPSDVDKVLDFESGVDRFELASDVFAGVGTAGGPMGAALFVIGTEATSPAHRVIYDPVSGMLWYDADGNGDAPAVPFAEVTPGTTVAAGDIWIG